MATCGLQAHLGLLPAHVTQVRGRSRSPGAHSLRAISSGGRGEQRLKVTHPRPPWVTRWSVFIAELGV
ncbi:hypothetical protein RRG08_009515 [Elysia crispata]|uniref:Uncharacterized protein n=1 Tax=Elysia crispata TaxID=231223 RepID=A0AAE1E9T4_9GAST|nr:hypothetical protein RRG08_009515 [Elysia crispata]